uniref:Uncharacterized protein n=1 Tax=Oryza punctata TaxID=4537 RepID=A0A0E0L9P0_ORYPU
MGAAAAGNIYHAMLTPLSRTELVRTDGDVEEVEPRAGATATATMLMVDLVHKDRSRPGPLHSRSSNTPSSRSHRPTVQPRRRTTHHVPPRLPDAQITA